VKSVPLTAYPRASSRRAAVRKLRAQGRVPAVIYGRQIKPQNLELNRLDLENLLHHAVSENLLLDLTVAEDGRAKRLALVQEIQHHPLSGMLLHVDLHEVSETEKVTVMVPVESVGEAAGVKTSGGVLEHVLFKIKVRALPNDLPEMIQVDVSHLEIGQGIHLGDIKAPPGVEVLGDKHISVLAVAAPVTEAQEAAAAAEAAVAPGEVEMIKEKKDETVAGAAPAARGAVAPAKGAVPAAKGAAVAGKGAAPGAKAGEKATEKTAEKAPEKGAEKKSAERKK